MENGKAGSGTRRAEEIEIGYHPAGYRIDKTASPMNRYTRWRVGEDGEWRDPEPVCFHALPPTGWVETDGFDWERAEVEEDA